MQFLLMNIDSNIAQVVNEGDTIIDFDSELSNKDKREALLEAINDNSDNYNKIISKSKLKQISANNSDDWDNLPPQIKIIDPNGNYSFPNSNEGFYIPLDSTNSYVIISNNPNDSNDSWIITKTDSNYTVTYNNETIYLTQKKYF